MSCALVAFVDLLRVCKVQSGYRWEFFRGGGGAGEDGGAGADSDIEHLDLNFSILYLLHAVLKEVGISAPGGGGFGLMSRLDFWKGEWKITLCKNVRLATYLSMVL